MDYVWCALLGAMVMWYVLSLLDFWRYHSSTPYSVEKVLDIIISSPTVVVLGVWTAVRFPFLWLWKFFRNAIKGVSIDTWNQVKVPKYWVIGNFRLCYDNRAKAWVNKVFLVRVIKPGNLVHEPALEMRKHP